MFVEPSSPYLAFLVDKCIVFRTPTQRSCLHPLWDAQEGCGTGAHPLLPGLFIQSSYQAWQDR